MKETWHAWQTIYAIYHVIGDTSCVDQFETSKTCNFFLLDLGQLCLCCFGPVAHYGNSNDAARKGKIEVKLYSGYKKS